MEPSAPLALLQILPATWHDLRAVAALERACFLQDSWPWIDVLAALTFPDTIRLKAVLDGRLVGIVFGDIRRREDVGWIASIGVHPGVRNRGIGRRLLAACEKALQTRAVRLTLRPTNRAALHLYQNCGYVETNRLEHYYRDGEGAIVMEKVLRRAPPSTV